MEKSLLREMETAIPQLKNEIYPLNAKENAQKPYLVYARTNTELYRTLEGNDHLRGYSYHFSVFARKYADMIELRDQIETVLESLCGAYLGDYFVQDLIIDNVTERFEHELKAYRGIIDFSLYTQRR